MLSSLHQGRLGTSLKSQEIKITFFKRTLDDLDFRNQLKLHFDEICLVERTRSFVSYNLSC